MKRELGYIYREPQIILQRAACGSRVAGWSPLIYVYAKLSRNRCCEKLGADCSMDGWRISKSSYIEARNSAPEINFPEKNYSDILLLCRSRLDNRNVYGYQSIPSRAFNHH